MKRLARLILAAALGLLPIAAATPAAAALNPTIVYQAIPGAPGVGRLIVGTITFGATDTYTTGGLTLTPQSLGSQVSVNSFIADSPVAAFETSATLSGGTVLLTLSQQAAGTSAVAATATTATVTIAGATGINALTANSPIYCGLNNAATSGGGTGTWTTTAAVSTCQYTSATSFTITTTAAAPTGGGNFTYSIPGISQQLAAGTPVGGLVIPFVAVAS